MSNPNPSNYVHSISEKLLNKAKEMGAEYNLVLTRYGLERVLYRISISKYASSFILKGSNLFLVWQGSAFRPTKDIDLLGLGSFSVEQIKTIYIEILSHTCTEDAIEFHTDFLKAEAIREDQKYHGVRVTVPASLGKSRISIQVDIGYGDAVTPDPEWVSYPTLVSVPVPKILAYSRYTVAAEKIEAVIVRGRANSRMKDFFDLCILFRKYPFDNEQLKKSVHNTFDRRNTPVPSKIPSAFTPDFYENPSKKTQWNSFIKKAKPTEPIGNLQSVVDELIPHILPIFFPVTPKQND